MSKKLLSLVLVAAFSMTLSACNKTEEKALDTKMEDKAADEVMIPNENTGAAGTMEEGTVVEDTTMLEAR